MLLWIKFWLTAESAVRWLVIFSDDCSVVCIQRKQKSSVSLKLYPLTNSLTRNSTARQLQPSKNSTFWISPGRTTADQSPTTLGTSWPRRCRHRVDTPTGTCDCILFEVQTMDDTIALRLMDSIPPLLNRLIYLLKVIARSVVILLVFWYLRNLTVRLMLCFRGLQGMAIQRITLLSQTC